jgi:phosphoglycerate dehydrogenase-like enzyme
LGIVGFGDIGQAAARLAIAFGMNIIALTRQPHVHTNEFEEFLSTTTSTVRILDSTTTPDAFNVVFAESDYILVATPLTKSTRTMIGKKQFDVAKVGSVLINVGRGPVIDEEALIDALTNNGSRLKGAALDVTTIEPLPLESPLWTLDNVLLSPHNMDMTATFMVESTLFFRDVQLPRFVRGLPLLNPVNVQDGY